MVTTGTLCWSTTPTGISTKRGATAKRRPARRQGFHTVIDFDIVFSVSTPVGGSEGDFVTILESTLTINDATFTIAECDGVETPAVFLQIKK
jgi:hypothetical protein